MQEAREDPGRRDTEASKTFSGSRYTAFSSRRRRKEAFTKGHNEVATEFKDVGTPACTRERERAQTADRVVVKYLDRKREHLPRTDDHAVVSEVPDGSPRVRRCKLPQSGGERAEKTRQFSRPDREEAVFSNNVT